MDRAQAHLSVKQSDEFVECPGDADEVILRDPATVCELCEATFNDLGPRAELMVAHYRNFLKHHEKNGTEGLL